MISLIPHSYAQEKLHRKRKRKLEIVRVIEEIEKIVDSEGSNTALNILEFGSGDGFQIPYLSRLGNVVASDLYQSEGVDALTVNFVKCSITSTPFVTGHFDVIYSNHVIEHISDLTAAFDELARIGSSRCIYALSVPTNIWLLLSVPAQYYGKVRGVYQLIFGMKSEKSVGIGAGERDGNNVSSGASDAGIGSVIAKLFPKGHGVNTRFWSCYRQFRISQWASLFVDHGFTVFRTIPLALYGPSEWPLVRTRRADSSFCSSVLFLLKK